MGIIATESVWIHSPCQGREGLIGHFFILIRHHCLTERWVILENLARKTRSLGLAAWHTSIISNPMFSPCLSHFFQVFQLLLVWRQSSHLSPTEQSAQTASFALGWLIWHLVISWEMCDIKFSYNEANEALVHINAEIIVSLNVIITFLMQRLGNTSTIHKLAWNHKNPQFVDFLLR